MTAYGKWVNWYDTDLLGEMGYVAPFLATEMLNNVLGSPDLRILDAGCGTGIVGKLLHEHDYLTKYGSHCRQTVVLAGFGSSIPAKIAHHHCS